MYTEVGQLTAATSYAVSICIPTYNRAAALDACLRALCRQTNQNFEVIIVDGGSTDNTQEVVRGYRDRLSIKWTTQRRAGLVAAANAGCDLAEGPIYTRTDDDAVAAPGWVENINRIFAGDPTIGGVTGPAIIPSELREGRDLIRFNERLRHAKGPLVRLASWFYYEYILEGQPYEVGRFFRSGAFSLGSGYPECLQLVGPQAVDYLEPCNMSVRTDLLRRMGGFDPSYSGVGDYSEPDLAFRLRSFGYRLVFDASVLVEHQSSTAGVFKARTKGFTRALNFIHFYMQHIKLNSVDKLLRFACYLALVNAYWLYKGASERNLGALGGVVGTVIGLIRYRNAGRI